MPRSNYWDPNDSAGFSEDRDLVAEEAAYLGDTIKRMGVDSAAKIHKKVKEKYGDMPASKMKALTKAEHEVAYQKIKEKKTSHYGPHKHNR
jgi:hypothetical protein